MKLDLFLISLSGFVSVTVSVLQPNSTIHFISQVMTYPEAKNYCRLHHTDLARVKEDWIMEEIKAKTQSIGIYTWPVWVGLFNDLNSWRFTLNNLLLTNTNFLNWNTGQPDNIGGVVWCGGMNNLGFWEDYDCRTLKPFICYNAANSGAAKFVGVATQMSWSGAQTYCRTYHTDLASAINQTDNDLLAQVASVQGPSWFGLFRDNWKWVNRTVASNLLWKLGEPDYNEPETCGCVRSGQFIDDPCHYGHYFFCETVPPVIYQIVKLQVMSDGSVFDPAVQSSILDKIYQKIEQHGMLQNTTVTWRMQPDGKNFYKKVVN